MELTFAKASEPTKLSSHTYSALLPDDWSIGSGIVVVPGSEYISDIHIQFPMEDLSQVVF